MSQTRDVERLRFRLDFNLLLALQALNIGSLVFHQAEIAEAIRSCAYKTYHHYRDSKVALNFSCAEEHMSSAGRGRFSTWMGQRGGPARV